MQFLQTDLSDDLSQLIGGNILSIITDGLHNNPLTLYREYIQNATDSIATMSNNDSATVEISINHRKSQITIRDSGPGLSRTEALRELVPIAKSKKQSQNYRGFMGIGRLSGITFCETLIFLTRQTYSSPITKVIWNGSRLRSGIATGQSVENIITKCVEIESFSNSDYPDHFFEVQLHGIARYAAALILNRPVVRKYLGEVCPVPFDFGFKFYPKLKSLLSSVANQMELAIYLDNEQVQITRPHRNEIQFAGEKWDKLCRLEEVKIPAFDGNGHAAIGWIAHSSYLGAIPKKLGIRGIRARSGNIQIGDEYVFDHLFSETRFNRWCVAEIHITDPEIKPNTRRDYFQPGVHLRHLENQLGAICRILEKQCRLASKKRYGQRHFRSLLDELSDTYALASCGYLTAEASIELIEQHFNEILSLHDRSNNLNLSKLEKQELNDLKVKFNTFKPREGKLSFSGVPSHQEKIYKTVFQAIVNTVSSPIVAKNLIESILSQTSIESNS